MVEVELDEKDYKTILSWYELAFAGKDIKANHQTDIDTLHKIGVMCKAHLREKEETT
jgi:hypothetical protein|tara:strand:- start:1074 stop:1244 length:171 start_codon:yes stop_codon:yes gene_type:complete